MNRRESQNPRPSGRGGRQCINNQWLWALIGAVIAGAIAAFSVAWWAFLVAALWFVFWMIGTVVVCAFMCNRAE